MILYPKCRLCEGCERKLETIPYKSIPKAGKCFWCGKDRFCELYDILRIKRRVIMVAYE